MEDILPSGVANNVINAQFGTIGGAVVLRAVKGIKSMLIMVLSVAVKLILCMAHIAPLVEEPSTPVIMNMALSEVGRLNAVNGYALLLVVETTIGLMAGIQRF